MRLLLSTFVFLPRGILILLVLLFRVIFFGFSFHIVGRSIFETGNMLNSTLRCDELNCIIR